MKNPSLKRNAIANYFGQAYVMLIGIVVTPLYLQHLGIEAYGLVGFFALLQTWMNLLDIGLTPTLGRQIAHARGKTKGFDEFRKLLKSFELIFFGLALLAVFGVYFASTWLANDWINAELLSTDVIAYCIKLMGVMIGLRWFSGLYRSGINGLEDQVWLNIANILLMTLKFVGALILLIFISNDIQHFFEYQLVIGSIELIVVMTRFYKKLPVSKVPIPIISFHLESVKAVAPFALGVAYTAGIWIFVSQVDKLILSGVLTLAEFGYFSLVVIIAAAINAITGPISNAIQPRMTYLLSGGSEVEMLALYRKATQLVTWVSMSVSIMVAFFAEPLIYAWTGNKEAASWSKDILFWFALGNGVLAIIAFQYYLQIAHGKLKLHILGATLSAIIEVPIIVYAALNYGALGAGITWFIVRVVWGLVWTPIVHHYFAPGLHLKWLFNDILIIVLAVTLVALLMQYLYPETNGFSRPVIFFVLIIMGMIVMAGSSLSSSFIRVTIKNKINRKRIKVIN